MTPNLVWAFAAAVALLPILIYLTGLLYKITEVFP